MESVSSGEGGTGDREGGLGGGKGGGSGGVKGELVVQRKTLVDGSVKLNKA